MRAKDPRLTWATLAAAIGLWQLPLPAGPIQYPQVAQPPAPPVFLPLPPGAIEPAGWLRDWALAARDGITGHLDEYHPVYGDAWKGTPVKAPNAAPDGTGWPLEQCAYWLDGLVRLGYALHDETLIRKAKERLDPVVEGVNRGGGSFIYWVTNPPAGFNSWAHSQMGRALLAYYEATGQRSILDALLKVYRAYPVPMGRLELSGGEVSGLCNLDAMLETYSLTGHRQLLERARSAIEQADVQASINKWLNGDFSPGHAVCAYEIIRLPALFFPWSNEPKYLQASRDAFRWFDEQHMLPYGVTSGEEFLSRVGAFRLTETCDVAAMLWSSAWLYRITGDRSWGDSIERAFFNAGPAPIARDFQTMCYYQSPNRIEAESLPSQQPFCPGPGCLRFTRLGYPHVLCCVGAMNRIIPNYILHLWMATHDQGLAATLYAPCAVNALAGPGIPVHLSCETDYPFDETIRIRVSPREKAAFALYFRVPAWCRDPQFAVNGASWRGEPDKRGFVRILREWREQDTVTLQFPMPVRLIHGFETEYPMADRQYFRYKPEQVFKQRRLPFESITRGPLLFALPIPDQDPNTPEPGARWQFALDNLADKDGGDIEVMRTQMPSKWNWPLDAPIKLTVPARAFDWRPTDAQALPPAPIQGGQPQTITLIPYGCTKFRISMFPVTEQSWNWGLRTGGGFDRLGR